MARILILAYGNPLRSDDGIAWRAADVLEDTFSQQDVEIIRLHQLAPELADTARNRDLVLFIDATCLESADDSRAGEVRVREVSGMESGELLPGQFSHVYSPARVLDLARELYGATPKAYVITVAAEDFGHGECLSPPVANALPELLVRVEQLVESLMRKQTPRRTRSNTKVRRIPS